MFDRRSRLRLNVLYIQNIVKAPMDTIKSKKATINAISAAFVIPASSICRCFGVGLMEDGVFAALSAIVEAVVELGIIAVMIVEAVAEAVIVVSVVVVILVDVASIAAAVVIVAVVVAAVALTVAVVAVVIVVVVVVIVVAVAVVVAVVSTCGVGEAIWGVVGAVVDEPLDVVVATTCIPVVVGGRSGGNVNPLPLCI